ncbi:MAG: glyoxalase [Cytophagales bacterium]|nr:MAG: glyoxalase [Cytophagales bacterium]
MRPEITTEPTAVTVAEQFQNQTIRPILKQLNDLILAYYRHHLPKRKVPFVRLTREDKLAHIERSIRDDTRLRLTLIGMVLGQFTPDEFATFATEEAELTRRIGNLLTQRVQSQVEEL